jgi:hypothetical protein
LTLVTLADFRPSPRADGELWTKALIEEADGPPEPATWTTVKEVVLEVNEEEDAAKPALRSFTVTPTKEWLRITFLDKSGGEDNPSPPIFAAGPPYRPTLAQVSAILRARTYDDNSEEAGEFNEDTRPTEAEVERDLIPQACQDVKLSVGRVPGELLEVARGVAAIRAAAEIERSYLPEQSEQGAAIYQTLRFTFDEEIETLCRTMQWWFLNEGALA